MQTETIVKAEQKGNDVYCLSKDKNESVAKFVDSGHSGAEIVDYGKGSVIRHPAFIPKMVLECIPSSMSVVVPSLKDSEAFVNGYENFKKIMQRMITERMYNKVPSFKLFHSIASKHELYADWAAGYSSTDYFGATGRDNNPMIRILTLAITNNFFEISMNCKVDEKNNPYIFLNIVPSASAIKEMVERIDRSRSECESYMTKINLDYSFITKFSANEAKDRLSSLVRGIDIWQYAAREILASVVVDALEELTGEGLTEYFKDSWVYDGVEIESANIVYNNGMVVPDGKVVTFVDEKTESMYLGELKKDCSFFPQVANVAEVKDGFVKLLNLSTLKEL